MRIKLAKNQFYTYIFRMHPIFHPLLIAVLTIFSGSLFAIEISNKAGVAIEVELLSISDEQVHVRMANGTETSIPLRTLSEASQTLVQDIQTREQNAHLALNETLGVDLFADTTLWDDSTESIASRLDWPKESETETQSSYRSYPKPDYRILDARPYSAVLYGESGMAQRISLVFANKGDFQFSDPPTGSEITQMERAIDKDVQQIEERLTEQLGEPERQQYGAGRGIKQLIKRWDWKTHAFLLASQDGEYATLKIVNTETADNKGRSRKLSDAKLRELTVGNILARPNGDTLIGNIPMVNQGPKGYCVPATFERYLRYMQIPADMYILAMAGQTKVGGGTSLANIMNSIDGYIASQSRSMKEYAEPIKLRTVKKHIDKGLPIIWTMFSSRAYNDFVNKRTKERLEVSDWSAWKDRTKKEARAVELRKDFFTAHACMIIGYNAETNEIAVSDSWGPSYAERWVPVEQAEQVSQGSIYLIGF